MKELNALLYYLPCVRYDYEDEMVHITPGKDSEKAEELYDYALGALTDTENARWYFDIALDCLRQLDDELLGKFIKEKEIKNYHFGTGLYVRNNYVYDSKLHSFPSADKVSAEVYKFMKGIVIPDFDPLEA